MGKIIPRLFFFFFEELLWRLITLGVDMLLKRKKETLFIYLFGGGRGSNQPLILEWRLILTGFWGVWRELVCFIQLCWSPDDCFENINYVMSNNSCANPNNANGTLRSEGLDQFGAWLSKVVQKIVSHLKFKWFPCLMTYQLS